jgi:hypothetical protein
MRKLKIEMDGYHSSSTQAIRQSDYIDVAFLAAGTAEYQTVPTDARIVLFSATSNFYLNARHNTAAVIPTGDITNGSGVEYNPIARLVTPAEKFSLIASTACIVTMAYYK